jgi:peptidyl-prolyl cis-trans isomerase SurA
MKRAFARTGVLLAILASVAGAQVVDRIAAVVNEDIILLSEVEEKLFILEATGQLTARDTTEVAKIRRQVLDRLIEEKLVVQRARSQGIEVDEQQVLARVDEAMNKVRTNFPNLEAYRAALADEGITENMLRERYQSDIEQEFLGQRIVAQEVKSQVQVSSEDAEKYFHENSDDLPRKPDEVQLAHWLASPVTSEQLAQALNRIEAARLRILAGTSFEDVAKDVSDDPSRANGGMLGWFSPGDLDPEFQAAVDTLEVGELSEPVRTRFGYHLIEVMARDNQRFQVRHILVFLDVSDEDRQAARDRADGAYRKLEEGMPFSELAATSDDFLTVDQGGELGWTQEALLLPDVKAALDTTTVGSYTEVVETDRGYHIFLLENRRSGDDYTYEEIKDQLVLFLQQKELEEAYDEWLTAVRDSAYIEIKAWER